MYFTFCQRINGRIVGKKHEELGNIVEEFFHEFEHYNEYTDTVIKINIGC